MITYYVNLSKAINWTLLNQEFQDDGGALGVSRGAIAVVEQDVIGGKRAAFICTAATDISQSECATLVTNHDSTNKTPNETQQAIREEARADALTAMPDVQSDNGVTYPPWKQAALIFAKKWAIAAGGDPATITTIAQAKAYLDPRIEQMFVDGRTNEVAARQEFSKMLEAIYRAMPEVIALLSNVG